jgi:hypothetical protein
MAGESGSGFGNNPGSGLNPEKKKTTSQHGSGFGPNTDMNRDTCQTKEKLQGRKITNPDSATFPDSVCTRHTDTAGSKEQAGGSADPGSATAPDPDLTPRQKETNENP